MAALEPHVMTTSQLRVIKSRTDKWEYSRPYTNVESGKLFHSAKDTSLQLSLRETVMYELALRKDKRLMDICEGLLTSNDIDEWLLGMKTLSLLGTDSALDRLIEVYMNADLHGRRMALDIIAGNVSADFAQPFSIMVREFIDSESMNVTSWTSVAIATLYHVCRRKGITIVFDGDPNYRPSITGFSESPDSYQKDETPETRYVPITKNI